ncbi:hypothetical protein [Silvimonas iriomotensis]|uniref:Transposase n=1 Tax=Silvimonas iriomotensis TaxID=449662 RepID=A0ABQ2P573_9NEIS|nr:hypothetical protein [Silvimonas iriomotensis]GGP18145.1 hypothetical protein GCM10010970_03400 [Silvimonas iriomotensis]
MGKALTTDFLRLDVRHLKREGLLIAGKNTLLGQPEPNGAEPKPLIQIMGGQGGVNVRYFWEAGGQKRDVVQSIYLDSSACHYGNTRPWFLCPICERRVALLYLSENISCRKCKKLAYPVQNVGKLTRQIYRMHALGRRIGTKPGLTSDLRFRPKGMHVRRYQKLALLYAEKRLSVLNTINGYVNKLAQQVMKT